MKTLTKMPTTQFSGLDYDNVIRDIYNLVKDNPQYNNNWDDFLSSSAGRMLIELFSYIVDQLATRIDWNVNENYLTTATQTKSILRLLKLIDYKLELPHCSIIPIKISLSKSTNKEIIFTPAYVELSGARSNIYTISGTDKNGNTKTFEAISYDSINDRFLYKNKVSTNLNSSTYNSVFNLNFYEGTTKISQFISSTSDNEKFQLPDSSVINNSIAVYVKRTVNSVLTEVELLKVNNFLENEAQDEDLEIPYVVNTLEDGEIEIEFAPRILMANEGKLLPVGSNLYVFYRTGGGTIGNLPIKAINFDRTIYTADGEAIDANFLNEESGYGGTDLETIDHAVLHGPLSLRSVNKAVTIEDYAAILARNPLVLKSVSYGCNNMPDDFYDKYGVYINPQEVWNFILLNKNYEGIPPSEYNNFKWMDTRLENRFNEIYSFNNSKFNNYCYYLSESNQELFLNYKTGSSKTFYNYIVISTSAVFKDNLGELNDGGDLILNTDLTFKITKLETSKLFFDNIGSITDTTENFIDSATNVFGMVNGSLVDYAEEDVNALFISPIYVENSSSDSNNVYGFDISTKYNIGIDIDGRGMIIIPLNDDYLSGDNKKIYLSNPNPLTKPTGGVYYNTLYEARYHKGIVEKINTALANDTTTYGANARPTQLMGLSLEDTTQASAFSDITTETLIPVTINGTIYTISYGGVDRTSQYYSDIVSYINADLSGSGFTCEIYLMPNGMRDIRFTSLIDNTISVEKTISNPSGDLLYYLYNDLTAVPLTASSGGDYSSVASVLTDSSGRKYLKITSPSTGVSSSIQFKASDFLNNLNNSTEFMDRLGVVFIGSVSSKVIGKRTITLVTNYETSLYGNLVFETNILGKDPAENRFAYTHYKGSSKDSIILGSVYDNFYSSDPDAYLNLNKVNYVYNTVLDEDDEVIMSDSDFQVAFTKTSVTTNSITNVETETNKVYIFPYDFIKLKTLDLDLINSSYFTSDDVLEFSIDGGALMTVQLSTIHTRLDFISALASVFNSSGYGSYLDYIEYDYDNPSIIYIKNRKRNLEGNIYFPQVADTNLFFQKIFGTPAENELKTTYWEAISNHPLGAQYVELTNHPYIDANYSPSGGFFDAITFDSRIKDDSYPGTYRTPDFYYSYDETNKELSMNKVNGNLIPDTEFYIHFVNDKRYKLDENNNIIETEDEQIKNYLDRYKISSLENKILPANFITFDIEATITCNTAYSLDSIKYGLEQRLRTVFGVENRNFFEPVVKSKVFAEIQNYPGILYSEISFLGTDFTNLATNVNNKIEVDFDTIAVLSEDIYNEAGTKQHGLLFNYVQSAI